MYGENAKSADQHRRARQQSLKRCEGRTRSAIHRIDRWAPGQPEETHFPPAGLPLLLAGRTTTGWPWALVAGDRCGCGKQKRSLHGRRLGADEPQRNGEQKPSHATHGRPS